MRHWLLTLLLLIASLPAHAREQITIAAADLKFAMDEIVSLFGKSHPDSLVTSIYGSSGKFQTQIRQGAPYDLYFSADIAYPRALKAEGLATGDVQPYALGRITRRSRDLLCLTTGMKGYTQVKSVVLTA